MVQWINLPWGNRSVVDSTLISFVMRKNAPILLVLVGHTGELREGGREADEIWVDLTRFKILYRIAG